jgi:hypothetical protein
MPTRRKRFLSALVATLILIPSLYFSYAVGRGMYYEYILFPKLKAEDHYILRLVGKILPSSLFFWTTAFLLFYRLFSIDSLRSSRRMFA